jgi:serine/threonine-protein kinase RsbW
MPQAADAHAVLVLASRFDSIEVAERALVETCAASGCAREDRYWLVTALREALANAILHGNRQNLALPIEVEYRLAGDTFTIMVSDQGEGFDPASIPDPTDPENLLRPSGRGIFYIRQFMDRVEYSTSSHGGTTVEMTRKVQPLEGSGEHEEHDS